MGEIITKEEVLEALHQTLPKYKEIITMEFVEKLITRTEKKKYRENVF
jgi:hypothetical protein